MNPCMYGQMIFEGHLDHSVRKGQSFNKCGDNWTSTCKRIQLDPYLIRYTKINSRWIKDLTIRAKTIKLFKEDRQENLDDVGFGNDSGL